MDCEWDERKRRSNLTKHGVDFVDACRVFAGPTVEATDNRRRYGEIRIGAYGDVDGVVLFVIYTWRQGKSRLISARKAGSDEREAFNAAIGASKRPAKGRTAWKRLARMTDGDIEARVAKDRDTFVPDAAWWQRAKVVIPGTKQLVSLRLDVDVLKWFRRQGRGYQTKINAVLRSYVAARRDRGPESGAS